MALGRPSAALSAALAGVFLAAVDQTVVLTAIPEMLQDVHVGLTQLDQASWIVTGYLLGYVSVLPLMGRLSDLYGRRRVFQLALGLFAAGSGACALASSLWWLVAARVCQAIGGGALLPVTFAFLADRMPRPRLPFWLGAAGAAAEAGGVLGPLYGAVIVQHLGWRWIFWLNVPLAAVIVLALSSSVRDPTPGRGPDTTNRSVDYAGAALFALALAALTIGLSGSSDPTRSASPIELSRAIPLTVVAAAALAAFIWRERRTAAPLLPLELFRLRPFSAANAVNALVGVALIAAMVDVPLFAATVLGRAPVDAGLALLRLTVCIPIGALLGGWLAARLRWDIIALAGLVLAAGGFALMHGWTLDVTDAAMTPGLVLAGAGFGLVIAPVTAATLCGVGTADRALSTALLTAMRMTGMTVGLAALTSVAFFRFNQLLRGLTLPLPLPGQTASEVAQRLAAYEAGITRAGLEVFTEVFLLAGVVCLTSAGLAPLLGRGQTG